MQNLAFHNVGRTKPACQNQSDLEMVAGRLILHRPGQGVGVVAKFGGRKLRIVAPEYDYATAMRLTVYIRSQLKGDLVEEFGLTIPDAIFWFSHL